MEKKEVLRPHAYIRKVQKRGDAYIPVKLQEELGILKDEKAEIPVFVDANVVFLVRKGAKREEVLKGLKILIEDMELRWKKSGEAESIAWENDS